MTRKAAWTAYDERRLRLGTLTGYHYLPRTVAGHLYQRIVLRPLIGLLALI